jgi:hypothetical protein
MVQLKKKYICKKNIQGEVMLNGPAVRDTILSQGKTATESAAFFWGNVTE